MELYELCVLVERCINFCAQDLLDPLVCPGCLWVLPGCFLGAFWVLPGSLLSASLFFLCASEHEKRRKEKSRAEQRREEKSGEGNIPNNNCFRVSRWGQS